MIEASILIYNVKVVPNNKAECSIYFEDIGKSKHLNLNDQITDSVGNAFVITDATLPFNNGGRVVLAPVTDGTLPVEDQYYTSIIKTPGKYKNYSEISTPGQILFSQVTDPSIYEYMIISQWNFASSVKRMLVGDSVVDSNGNEYRITEIKQTQVNGTVLKVVEQDHRGIYPKVGIATLYRSTNKLKLFTGGAVSMNSFANIKARDSFIVDRYISNLQDTVAQGGSTPPPPPTPIPTGGTDNSKVFNSIASFTVVDELDTRLYQAVKWLVYAEQDDTPTNQRIDELNALYDNVSNAIITPYRQESNGDNILGYTIDTRIVDKNGVKWMQLVIFSISSVSVRVNRIVI